MRTLIITNLTAYIIKIDRQVGTANTQAAFHTAASVFLSLNPQKDSEYYNDIFNAVYNFIKNNNKNYIVIACDTMTRMKLNFNNKQAEELTNLMLVRCEKKESCESEFRLLGALIPFHHNTKRQMILDFLIKTIGISDYFPDAIANCSSSEQWTAATYVANIIARNKPKDPDYSPCLFISMRQILKNKKHKEHEEYQEKIDKEIDASLQLLPQPVTQLICSYRR